MIKKLNIFSGMQPSGIPTLGNYIGVLRQWKILQKIYNSIYCIADLHYLTNNKENSKILFKRSLDLLAIYLACDIDPNESVIFLQSHIPEHSQLSWILNCYTYFGELTRMVQFKEKIKNKKNINLGLLSYPVLMASDILLYQTDIVPVGKDQIQHLELSRTIARRFNKLHGDVFIIPEKIISKTGSKIMSLSNPNKKMSKSNLNRNNFISLLDQPYSIIEKIKNAKTDSDNPPKINFDIIKKPGISNLLSIISELRGINIKDLEISFKNKSYKYLKNEVTGAVLEHLKILQKKYFLIRKDEKYLINILKSGSKKAKKIARGTLKKVNESIGLLNF
ncbi:trpS [Wigglesworthia glossinidia endosymbiont of Glossina brevipalpis]|uniref:Tryptophan--tRNA ligase n=1 Tax=Wigglesworthia glossinidia brevipalpis TaxID=36870 RepID=SYW_WIGBR|nr:RecName: Full=Tryptophan--tRNA ligase; AltName: Full=Tryptophanyl-tRNA synthetase; Short=TrpRS [Wigglesworthia glossinidia endosymbiont of Glossina brevipalpis]BAC24727.1 trpS [Wigglesworthia glossinidia endosymbiont of Glossina brevipalpis]